MKLDGIEGSSSDKSHPHEIEVLSFSWGVSNAGSIGSVGGAAGNGTASFSEFKFVSNQDKSSSALFQKCVTGEHIKTATLSVRKAGGGNPDFYKVQMMDVLVSEISEAGSEASQADVPMEQISLNFAKVEIVFRGQSDADSSDITLDPSAGATS
jgi:type VI secretion system secreted protein Hcp